MLIKLAAAFLLTIITEGALIMLITRTPRSLYYCFLCNLMTNPLLNAASAVIYSVFGLIPYYIALAALEICAVFAEAAAYRALLKISMKKALALSLILNAASFAAGLLIPFDKL